MSSYGLRHYIPVGALARREPVVGDEPYLRLSLGFVPRWYHDRLGSDFSEKWHLDPVYRYQSVLKMRQYLHQRFPMVPEFQPRMRGATEERCATISSCHGVMLMPMLYGRQVVYTPDGWPDSVPNQYIPKEELKKLRPFDLSVHPVVVQLWQQMDIIEANWGAIDGYLVEWGVLNIAFRVRGPDIFADMVDDSGFVEALFEHITQTILDLFRLVQARQRASGFPVNQLSVSNCVANMISPNFYRRFVLPYDLRLSREFERFGVHTCNWDATPYLDAIRTIDKVGYLDMGIMSDMRRTREMFPDARRCVLLGPVTLLQKSIPEIRTMIEKIADELAPCDICVGDVDTATPDETVLAVIRLLEEVSWEKGQG